ncbi:MAG: mitochondrial fission ELM1 family protein [Alphaproteobacteria bacterium]|nr:mitochondrial fission ELM1 family protein [Alphaproteobacteria bacterium]
MDNMKTIWVLTDDRAGNNNQSLGVAESLGLNIVIKKLCYNKWIRLPNVLRGNSSLGIKKECLKEFCEPYPDIAIAAGRRASTMLRYLKKKSKGKTKIVQIMFPGAFNQKDYDLIVLPQHDGCHKKAKNILRIIGAAHRVNEEKLKIEKEKWFPIFSKMEGFDKLPKVSLIIGGATKDKPFTKEMAQDLADKTNAFVKSLGGAFVMVTTSRRTGVEQEKIIDEALKGPKFFYHFGDTNIENPYFGLLSCADYIIVTGDSVSMCSEAAAGDKPVLIFAPNGFVGKKHAMLHSQLYATMGAQPLTDNVEIFPHKTVFESKTIANYINKNLL